MDSKDCMMETAIEAIWGTRRSEESLYGNIQYKAVHQESIKMQYI
jgi:hypothetical protein